MPYLSKIDIEAIANRIIDQYKLRYIPSKRLFYRVDPIELAEMLGLSVYFRQLSYDHSILGMTAPDEVMVPIFDENKERSIFILDGKTVLIESCLNHSPKAKGRRNFTIAHECAHQILYRLYPKIYGPNQRVLCDYRRNNAPKRKIADWEFVQECAIPQMIIKLRQGAGRLIRTENDTGVIAETPFETRKAGGRNVHSGGTDLLGVRGQRGHGRLHAQPGLRNRKAKQLYDLHHDQPGLGASGSFFGTAWFGCIRW